MHFLKAALITGFLLVPTLLLSTGPLNFFYPLLILTSLWAGWDSFSKGLYRYDTGLPKNPIGVALAVGLFWVVGFPWYLMARSKLGAGALKATAIAA